MRDKEKGRHEADPFRLHDRREEVPVAAPGAWEEDRAPGTWAIERLRRP